MRYTILIEWLTASGLSLILNILLLGIIALITSNKKEIKNIEYIPVDIIKTTPSVKKVTPEKPKLPVKRPPVKKKILKKASIKKPKTEKKASGKKVVKKPLENKNRLQAPLNEKIGINEESIETPLPETQMEQFEEEGGLIGSELTNDSQSDSINKETVYQPFYEVTKLPDFKERVKPEYPSSERSRGIESLVIAEIYINEHGMVDEVMIIKSGGILFDQAVIEAVKSRVFQKAKINGKTIAVMVKITYKFKLR